VQPCKLVYKSKAWYLKAFCTKKQGWRIFKLNRILEFELLEKSFARRECPEPTDMAEGEYREIVLRFPKEMAYRVYDEFDQGQIQRQANGELIVSAKMPEDTWLIGSLLSFGAQVEIVSPTDLKEVLAEQARIIYEKNKT
ncbi:MAG: WYL domain-containing protein, partial [Lachnospiraceae bacterium]|nr:WYL domain-containing protein [Lachnospiraceae bacterium]